MFYSVAWGRGGRSLVTARQNRHGGMDISELDLSSGRETTIIGAADSLLFAQLGVASPNGKQVALWVTQQDGHQGMAIISLEDRRLRHVALKKEAASRSCGLPPATSITGPRATPMAAVDLRARRRGHAGASRKVPHQVHWQHHRRTVTPTIHLFDDRGLNRISG